MPIHAVFESMIDIKEFWRPLAPCLFTSRVYATSLLFML